MLSTLEWCLVLLIFAPIFDANICGGTICGVGVQYVATRCSVFKLPLLHLMIPMWVLDQAGVFRISYSRIFENSTLCFLLQVSGAVAALLHLAQNCAVGSTL